MKFYAVLSRKQEEGVAEQQEKRRAMTREEWIAAYGNDDMFDVYDVDGDGAVDDLERPAEATLNMTLLEYDVWFQVQCLCPSLPAVIWQYGSSSITH